MAVNKKYLKIGVAGLAVVALVIGLSVGLTQKSKNKSAEMGASAATDGSSVYSDFEEDCTYISGKSGKSGGGGGKSGKSGGTRRLVVPGTEDYEKVEINSGKRRLLKADMDMVASNDMDMVASDSPTYSPTSTGVADILDKSDESRDGSSGKSGKSSGKSGKASGKSGKSSGSSGKSGKSVGSESSCRPKIKDTCDSSPSGKSGKSGGGKSGKSGGSKSGKSSGGGSSGSGKSGKSGSGSDSPMGGDSGCSCSSGKSGKSGGGKSGKSGGSSGNSGQSGSGSGSGKSGKSEGYCSCDSKPTVCNPPDIITPLITPSPSPCVCEDQMWTYDGLQCIRGCGVEGSKDYNSESECCVENFSGMKCNSEDTCLPPLMAPEPTPAPTDVTPPPSPTAVIITEEPTAGSTPTVSTEVTGPPTVARDEGTTEDEEP